MSVYVIGGQAIHAIEEGPPQYQTALLVHGWCSSWYALSPLVGMLLSQRFHCVAVDLPGYGKSPPFPHRATIPHTPISWPSSSTTSAVGRSSISGIR